MRDGKRKVRGREGNEGGRGEGKRNGKKEEWTVTGEKQRGKRLISSGKTKRGKLKDLYREKGKAFKIRITGYTFIVINTRSPLQRLSSRLKMPENHQLPGAPPPGLPREGNPSGALRRAPGPHPLKRSARYALPLFKLYRSFIMGENFLTSPTFDCTPGYAPDCGLHFASSFVLQRDGFCLFVCLFHFWVFLPLWLLTYAKGMYTISLYWAHFMTYVLFW